MADSEKILGQLNPAATTLTDLYTVPAATRGAIGSIMACNRGASQGTIRISLAVAGAGDDPKQYLYYDLPVNAKDTFACTLGIMLGAADVVRVWASSTDFSFNIFGVEVT